MFKLISVSFLNWESDKFQFQLLLVEVITEKMFTLLVQMAQVELIVSWEQNREDKTKAEASSPPMNSV